MTCTTTRPGTRPTTTPRSHLRTALKAATAAAVLGATVVASGATASAAGYPSDSTPPDLVSALGGYFSVWQPSGANDLHGTVKNPGTLQWNDRLTSWINQNATKDQQFRALQNSAYKNADGSGYDQSISIADGLGQSLGKIYATGRIEGKLPLVDALISSENGTTGAYVGTGQAKATFSYPRPFLAASATSKAVEGDEAACDPSKINGSSVTPNRTGKDWANADGSLKITRLAPVVDSTHDFASTDVTLDPGYGTAGICTGGSYPSGHTTTAYQAGITLATLLPELAPEILARTSEAGNNRIVLGVHYPLDIMGGRIDGEAALATRWSDAQFRTEVLTPARQELINYLQAQCGDLLAKCIAKDKAYTDNPYGGKAIPGGTSQIVTDRQSAVKVYTERLDYGFTPTHSTTAAPAVPQGAENLLLTAFPTLTDAQRTSVLAQTQVASGNVLDLSGTSNSGSWQRLNLAAATSATVQLNADGSVKVTSVGGEAKVVKAGVPSTPTPEPSSPASPVVPPATNPSATSTGSPSRPGLPSTGV